MYPIFITLSSILLLQIYIFGGATLPSKADRKLTVYVINLDKNVDRWKNMQRDWSHMFELKRISAKTHPNPVCGLALSQLYLFKMFKKSKEDILIVMEDDAYPGDDSYPGADLFYLFIYNSSCGRTVDNMNISFVENALAAAIRLPQWHVLNFAPWFTKQPQVRKINKYLVAIDYFHAAHFVAFHRRAIPTTLKEYKKLISKGNCIPVDDWFGNYGKRLHIYDFFHTASPPFLSLLQATHTSRTSSSPLVAFRHCKTNITSPTSVEVRR